MVERTRRGRLPGRAGVWIAHADGSQLRRVAPSMLWEVAWSPDGRKLALQGMERYTVDLRTGRERFLGESEYAGAYSVSESYGLDWQPLPS